MSAIHPNWQDLLLLEQQLTDEERAVRNSARQYAQQQLQPRIQNAWREEHFDRDIFREMGDLGFLGCTLQDYGSNASYISYGLIAQEIERIDSSYRSLLSVQSSLVMYPIDRFGSDKQRQTYLPKLASGEWIGCFGLTEPDSGSDPASLTTRAIRRGDNYCLNGNKQWITNAPVADLFIIWAKDENNDIGAYLLPKNTPGLNSQTISGKFSLRASPTGSISLLDATIPSDYKLPNATGLTAAFACLIRARYGIGWGSIGAATACWHAARQYSLDRQQFGAPLACRQLIQKKLADMQSEICLGQLLALQVGKLFDRGNFDPTMVSMLKRNNCVKSLDIARQARDIHGGNGISDDYPVIRHMLNLEAVNTYEGTQDIHSLILGRAQTGHSAFN